jgi:uncharacterized protein
MTDWDLWLTCALAGLGGAAPCAAMCGPLTLALGADSFGASRGSLSVALRFNLGRLLAYGAAGGATAALVTTAVHSTDLIYATTVMRILGASLLGVVGLGLLGLPGLPAIERRFAPLWRVIRAGITPLTRATMRAPRPWRPFLFGLLWLFVPCGLVWSMLLVAATQGSFAAGAMTMLAFGIGTAPAVLSITIAGTRLVQLLNGRQTRRLLGVVLVLMAVVGVAAAAQHAGMGSDGEHAHHHSAGS